MDIITQKMEINLESNNDVSSPTESNNDVSSPTESNNDMSSPTESNNDVSSPTESNNDVSSLTESNNDVSSPTESNNDVSSPTESNNDVSSPTESNNDVSSLIESFGTQLNIRQDNLSQPDNECKLLDILRKIDWKRFHNLCLSIGKDLNDPQWRFLKAIFLENAVANYSNNELTYVGDSEQGCDFRVEKLNNLKIEMKYVEGCIFSGKKLLQRKTTSEIKLMNSNGTNTHLELPDTYSDYLLIVDLHGAALISKEILKNYIILGGDGIKAKIPTDKLHIIFQPSDITETNKKDLQIKEIFMNAINNIINSV